MLYTIVLSYAFSPAWLNLTRDERNAMEERYIQPVFAKYADQVSARFFDAEAFHAQHTDFALLETTDLQAYYHLVEELRDTPLIGGQYLAFTDIKIGIEDGYRAFEESTAGSAASAESASTAEEIQK
ncbi:darcynin family protein [Streptomyces sp. NPDC051162]|uniref:darcynin family protein n=1 Tax=unclassified Streptomyces TaxID=2593676 RepID=UPI00341396B9